MIIHCKIVFSFTAAVCLFVATCLAFLSGLDGASGLEDSDLPGVAGDHSLVMDTSGPKLPDFANRPAGDFILLMAN